MLILILRKYAPKIPLYDKLRPLAAGAHMCSGQLIEDAPQEKF